LTGADTKAAQQKTELRATVTAGQHTIDKERTGQIVTRTISDIRRQLPAAVDGMAARKSAEYVAAKLMRGSDMPARDNADAPGVMDLEDLVTYLVEERLKERERAMPPVAVSDNGHGPSAARPTHRPDGR
jgi:hypothetical protein